MLQLRIDATRGSAVDADWRNARLRVLVFAATFVVTVTALLAVAPVVQSAAAAPGFAAKPAALPTPSLPDAWVWRAQTENFDHMFRRSR